jgi:hypothetical protein
MIPVVRDNETRTLLLIDAKFERVLYWSPMWAY